MLMRLPCRERSDAKEERNDRAYPEAPPLPNVNESRRNQSVSFKNAKGIDVRSNRSGQTLEDEKVCIRSVIGRLSPRPLAECNDRFGWNKVEFKRVYIGRIELETLRSEEISSWKPRWSYRHEFVGRPL